MPVCRVPGSLPPTREWRSLFLVILCALMEEGAEWGPRLFPSTIKRVDHSASFYIIKVFSIRCFLRKRLHDKMFENHLFRRFLKCFQLSNTSLIVDSNSLSAF